MGAPTDICREAEEKITGGHRDPPYNVNLCVFFNRVFGPSGTPVPTDIYRKAGGKNTGGHKALPY